MVHSFSGSDAEHARLLRSAFAGEEWSGHLQPAELSLCPAACHPLYPACTGRLPPGGRRFELTGHCFRHEPSLDPARLQAFRMHEFVYIGEPDTAASSHRAWAEVAARVIVGLGLDVRPEVANDPFFGRTSELLAERQRVGERKIELVAALPAYGSATAVASCNWHQQHFGEEFQISTAAGDVADSSCVGFGLDRLAIALFATHGLEPASWPGPTRQALWPEQP